MWKVTNKPEPLLSVGSQEHDNEKPSHRTKIINTEQTLTVMFFYVKANNFET